MKLLFWFFVLCPLLLAAQYDVTTDKEVTTGQVVEYHLYVKDTILNNRGKKRRALAINGSIPAPTLFFTEGDTAIIHVHNLLRHSTSTHWHGLLLPNEQDGVPYLTTAPIKGGTTHTFRFPITHSGTYWYHSHTALQEQAGLYGSIVIQPRNYQPSMREEVVLLSDWTNERPSEVMRSLKRETDWYAIKKGSVQSWGEATLKGYFVDKLKQEWRRMPPMDIADVYYHHFFANGKDTLSFPQLKAGEQIKLRVINGSASSYFYLHYSGGDIQVVAADGIDVVPVSTKRLLIATAETYDIIVTVPDNHQYELQATVQDISGSASVWLGSGLKMPADNLPPIQYFEMMRNMNRMRHGKMKNMDHGEMNHEDKMHNDPAKMSKDSSRMVMPKQDHSAMAKGESHQAMEMGTMASKMEATWSYDQLRALTNTTFPQDRPVREIKLTATGNMNRYVWTFNNKPLFRETKITIKKGENVRFVINNQTMMSHPLHLHGHFFRLLNQHGTHSPLKHTFNLQPMETQTIEFEADEEKDWFFHCHVLYHMSTGMARVVSYADSPVNTQVPDRTFALRQLKKKNWRWYFMGSTALHSQANYGEVALSNIYNAFDFEWRINWNLDYETEFHYSRFLDNKQFLRLVLGADIRLREGGEANTKDNRQVAHIGLQYTLPLFIEAELRLDHTGRVRFQLSREDIALGDRLRFNWMVNTDWEYLLGLQFIISKNVAISTNYDSDFGWGAGVTFTY